MDLQNQKTEAETRPIIEVDFNTFQFPMYVDSRTKQTVDLNPFFKEFIGIYSPFDNLKGMLEMYESCFDYLLVRVNYEKMDTTEIGSVMFYLTTFRKIFAKMGKLRDYHFI